MAKVISQETFDDVVKENIVEFSMSTEEAKKETIEQFEAQGINLANIIKDLSINEDTGRPILNETIEKLNELSTDSKPDPEELVKLLDVLASECALSVPHRVVSVAINWFWNNNKRMRMVIYANRRWQRTAKLWI